VIALTESFFSVYTNYLLECQSTIEIEVLFDPFVLFKNQFESKPKTKFENGAKLVRLDLIAH